MAGRASRQVYARPAGGAFDEEAVRALVADLAGLEGQHDVGILDGGGGLRGDQILFHGLLANGFVIQNHAADHHPQYRRDAI